jgi:hypothetical protein
VEKSDSTMRHSFRGREIQPRQNELLVGLTASEAYPYQKYNPNGTPSRHHEGWALRRQAGSCMVGS